MHRIKQKPRFEMRGFTITPSGEPLPLKGCFQTRQPPAGNLAQGFQKTNWVYADVENVLHPNFWSKKLTRAGVVLGGDRLLVPPQSKFNSRKLLALCGNVLPYHAKYPLNQRYPIPAELAQ